MLFLSALLVVGWLGRGGAPGVGSSLCLINDLDEHCVPLLGRCRTQNKAFDSSKDILLQGYHCQTAQVETLYRFGRK